MMQRTIFVGFFCAFVGLGTCLPPICVLECMQQWLTCEINCQKTIDNKKSVAAKICSKDCATGRRTCLDPCTIFADLRKKMEKTREKLTRYDLKSHKSQQQAAQTIKEEIAKHRKPTAKPVVPPPVFPTTTPEIRKHAPGTKASHKDKTTRPTTPLKRPLLAIEAPKTKNKDENMATPPPPPELKTTDKEIQIKQLPTTKTNKIDKRIQIPPPPPLVKPIPETPTVKPGPTTNAAKAVLEKADISQTTSGSSNVIAKKKIKRDVV